VTDVQANSAAVRELAVEKVVQVPVHTCLYEPRRHCERLTLALRAVLWKNLASSGRRALSFTNPRCPYPAARAGCTPCTEAAARRGSPAPHPDRLPVRVGVERFHKAKGKASIAPKALQRT
jgi:hypothetical protein